MNFDKAPRGEIFRRFANLSGVALQLNEELLETFSYHSPRQHTLEEARAAIVAALPDGFELLQNEGQLISRRGADVATAGNRSASGVVTLRSPGEYRRAFENLHKALAQYERHRSMMNKETPLDEDTLHILETVPKLKNQLAACLKRPDKEDELVHNRFAELVSLASKTS
ncbi:MAG: hypothetical protein H6821_04810 [Planctomycetaceae bacterium]|nr:hypothetical protein [Planctomycetaceae bacterium]MCB9940391.1 hypothetical protein [Planctomycetaceae bacterium]